MIDSFLSAVANILGFPFRVPVCMPFFQAEPKFFLRCRFLFADPFRFVVLGFGFLIISLQRIEVLTLTFTRRVGHSTRRFRNTRFLFQTYFLMMIFNTSFL